MATSSLIALGIAVVVVAHLIIGIGFFSLSLGALDWLLGGPKFTFLKSRNGATGFAFNMNWNSAKEPAKIDYIRVKLFNPFGSPSMLEVTKSFPAHKASFSEDLEMGSIFSDLVNANGIEKSRVEVEVGSSKDGVSFQFEHRGTKFKKLYKEAKKSVDDYENDDAKIGKPPIDVPLRSFIADTVPGNGAQVVLPTNPAFAEFFKGMGTGDGTGGAEAVAVENFSITKVWIEPGCIVCNACEDIYPEVFEVTSDTCLIRPGAPLDDGLKIEESAEACPVEVIKFTKAG